MGQLIDNEFPLVCIVAISKNNIIGDGKKLLWNLSGDLIRLKKITMGNPLIMGRKTFDSIGFPLPGRANIVLTKNKNWKKKSVLVAKSLNEAVKKSNDWISQNFDSNAKSSKKIFIFGGGQVYDIALRHCKKIEMTIVDLIIEEGIEFPNLKHEEWKKIFLKENPAEGSNPSFSFWRYERQFNK